MISLVLLVLLGPLAPKGAIAMHQTPHLKVDKKLDSRELARPPKKVDPVKKVDPPKKIEPVKKVDLKVDPRPALPCLRYPITVTHGLEETTFPLTTCDGNAAPGAIEQLSILARPEIAEKPKATVGDLMKVPGEFIAPGIKRVDERLPHALQVVLDHFDKTGLVRQVHLISGYRPASKGSYHATAQALDVRIDGLSNAQIASFCRTLSDIGCGYYPNSSFVHIDVRPEGTGHVAWIDASGPGEAPQYVSTWPPPRDPFADDPRQDFVAGLPPLPRM